MQNEQQLKKFNEVYNNLNEQQRKAVDTIEGPVMVIAGPGTGKTQILGSRIGKILLETDAQPQNILCLTYTDAGVVAMRKRLLNFIGVDAYKVNVCTFHAFCNEVIQDNLNLFEKNTLDAISELESIDLFRKLIDNFKKGHPLKRYRGDVYFEIFNLQALFGTLKKEGWNVESILPKIDQYITELPTKEGFFYKRKYKQFNLGDPKQPIIDAEIEKATKLKAALGEFENYNNLMKQYSRYDYNDMINWVITAFEENKNLLAQYQEQYLYILVDEFQDTSGTQNKIVELLINYWDQPNVFVVGDDDQSIFRFQGANVANMKNFVHQYKDDLATIVLTKNYRSTQPILNSAKIIINKNEDRLIHEFPQLSKDLVAANTQINTITQLPSINVYTTQREEMIGVTESVAGLLANGTEPKHIAIIYKEHKYGEELAKYFNLKNIPYYSKRSMNLFDIPLAKKIIHVLYYLATEHDIPYSGDEMLFELLHFDWFGISPIDIAKVTIEVANAKWQKENKIESIRQLLVDKATQQPKDLFDMGTLKPELKNVILAIEQLLKDVPNTTLQNLFQNVLNELGVLHYIMNSTEKHWNLQILTALFDLVKEETHRNPSMSLQEFVTMLQTMQQEDLKLPLYQIHGNDKGVSLLTCHGSKGLEFTYVFVVGVNAHFWEKKRNRADAYNLSKYLQLNDTHPEEDHPGFNIELEELRRLFYVAVTRAEQELQLSYFNYKNDGKEVEPSMFIAEINENQELPVHHIKTNDTLLNEYTILELGKEVKPTIEQMEDDMIARSLEKFSMNVTALNAYLNCPLAFYYKNLIRIPSPKNESTEFGSSVHYALDQLFKKMLDSGTGHTDRKFPSKAIFINDFEWYMKKHRESFTKEQFKKRMEYGPIILSAYYDKYVDNFEKVVSVERRISKVVVKGVPLKGAIDKLEFDGKLVNVVDYKTGDYEKAKKIKKQFDPPNEKNENGGDYWRQAVFYKILIDNYELKDWKVISTEFDFIEPNNQKEYFREKIVITPEDITTVTHQIESVWQKIQNREFYTGCGKEDCHWCNFVKDNKLDISTDVDETEPNDEIKEPVIL
jgi:DNA helicase II / ATP-dependent DNA helicase PcrA